MDVLTQRSSDTKLSKDYCRSEQLSNTVTRKRIGF